MKNALAHIWNILWRIVAGILSCICLIVVVFTLPEIANPEGREIRHWLVFALAAIGAICLPLAIFPRSRRK